MATSQVTNSPPLDHQDAKAGPSTFTLWTTLLIVLVADGLDLMDATITNIGAPAVAAELGGGPALVEWLGAGYALALGSLLVVGGRLGDRYGQRRVFLIGLTGFVAASALAGLAWNPAAIIVARVVQGSFGALLIPQGMAIMTRTFPKDALAKAFGAFGPMLGIFGVGGPILAGFLIDANILGLGWRPMFLLNIVVGGVALVAAIRWLPTVEGDPTVQIDVRGSLLLIGTTFTLLFGLIEGSSEGWSALSFASTAASVLFFGAFVARQRTSPQPLVAPSLLRNRGFSAGLATGLLVFAAFNGLMYVIALYFQLGLGFSPSQAALNLLPLTIGIIIASGVWMALPSRPGRAMVLVGLLTTIAGTTGFLLVIRTVGTGAAWWQIALPVLIIGIGAGACFSSIFATALGSVAPEEAGAASGSLSAIQQIAAGLGLAVITSAYLGGLPHGQVHALTTGLVVVLGISAACLLAVPLLPRTAAAVDDH